MQVHINPQKTDAAIQVANQPAKSQVLYTVEQFSLAQPAFSTAALRNLIFKADPRQTSRGKINGNGLIESGAIIRIGRKILIDGERFLVWVRQQGREV